MKAKAGFDMGLEISVKRRVNVLMHANLSTILPVQPSVHAP